MSVLPLSAPWYHAWVIPWPEAVLRLASPKMNGVGLSSLLPCQKGRRFISLVRTIKKRITHLLQGRIYQDKPLGIVTLRCEVISVRRVGGCGEEVGRMSAWSLTEPGTCCRLMEKSGMRAFWMPQSVCGVSSEPRPLPSPRVSPTFPRPPFATAAGQGPAGAGGDLNHGFGIGQHGSPIWCPHEGWGDSVVAPRRKLSPL